MCCNIITFNWKMPLVWPLACQCNHQAGLLTISNLLSLPALHHPQQGPHQAAEPQAAHEHLTTKWGHSNKSKETARMPRDPRPSPGDKLPKHLWLHTRLPESPLVPQWRTQIASLLSKMKGIQLPLHKLLLRIFQRATSHQCLISGLLSHTIVLKMDRMGDLRNGMANPLPNATSKSFCFLLFFFGHRKGLFLLA